MAMQVPNYNVGGDAGSAFTRIYGAMSADSERRRAGDRADQQFAIQMEDRQRQRAYDQELAGAAQRYLAEQGQQPTPRDIYSQPAPPEFDEGALASLERERQEMGASPLSGVTAPRPRRFTEYAAEAAAKTGNGREASKLIADDEKQREERELQIIKAIDESPERGKYLAKRYGIEVPEQIYTDARLRKALTTASTFGYTDPQQRTQVAQLLYQGVPPGEIGQRVGAPKVRATADRFSPITITDADGSTRVGAFSANSGQVRDTGVRGTGGRGGAAGGGRASVFEQKQRAWLAVHPGDNQGALEYANGRAKLDPAKARMSVINSVAKETDMAGRPLFKTPEERQAEADRRLAYILQLDQAPPEPAGGTPPGPGSLAPGAVVDGFRFKGGSPNDEANWEPE